MARAARAVAVAAPSAPGPVLLQDLLGYNLRRAQVALSRDFQRSVGEGKIRPVIFSILVLAEATPGVAQVDLARQLGLDKASVVALIDRLEAAGLLERRRSTLDRRRQGLFLTTGGADLLQGLKQEVAQHERRFRERFSAAEAAQLITLLQRLYDQG